MKGSVAALRERLVRSRFVRNVGRLWAAQGVALAAGAIQGVLVARWLGPAAFGTAALVIAVPSVVATIFDARAADAGVRYLGEFAATGDLPRASAFARVERQRICEWTSFGRAASSHSRVSCSASSYRPCM